MSTQDENGKEFGVLLKDAREMREINQTELANLTGLQPAAIGHFESGRRKPSFANIRILSRALNVSSDYLLGKANDISGATTAFRNEDKLSHHDREMIQKMIDTFASK